MRRIGSAESPRVIAASPTEEKGEGKKKGLGCYFMLRLLIRGNSCCCRNLRIVWGSFSRPFPIVPGKKNRKDLIFFLTFPPENIPQFVYMHGGREGAQHVALCSVISYPPPMARKRSRRGGKSIRASNSSIGSRARRKFDCS